jgi:hypothetical protein
MTGGAFNGRGTFVLVAIVTTLLLATGCGGSGSSEVTVQTGSLSKAKFIEKADAICKAARTEFLAKYTRFAESHKAELTDPKQQEAFLSEVLESVLGPNVEGEVKRISELGAPSNYAPEVATFLNALERRLDEAHANPSGLTATPTTFKKAEDAARRAGMYGCSESFS